MGRFDALTQLEDAPEQSPPAPAVPTVKVPKKKTSLLANQQTSKTAKSPLTQEINPRKGRDTRPAVSPPPSADKTLDTSLLTTKEKTKYGSYLTDESIEKIRIRAIQRRRDDHQILQEAVNQYFEKQEK